MIFAKQVQLNPEGKAVWLGEEFYTTEGGYTEKLEIL